MIVEPPSSTESLRSIEAPPSVTVARVVEPRTRFWRTLVVIAGHWLLQAIICAMAQYDKSRLSEWCVGLISIDTFIHIILLSSFAGMVLRSRFLFSWSFGFALLSFAISCGLGYLSVNFQQGGWFGPEFILILLHVFIAWACAFGLVFWPIFGWRYELTRNVVKGPEGADDQSRFQFSIVGLCYITLTVAMLSFAISQMYDGVLNRVVEDDAAGWWVAAFCALGWLINIALLLRSKFSLTTILKTNIFGWAFILLFFMAVSRPNSRVGLQSESFMFGASYVAFTIHLYLSALAYRWAGWRLVRFAGHNKSIFKQAYRFLTDAR